MALLSGISEAKDFRSQADKYTKGEPVYQKQGLAAGSVPQYRKQG